MARILLILFFLVTSLQAAEIAKYAGEFMYTGVGARALGMGGAYVAPGGDATYGYWNPAGLTSIDYPEITAMHAERFGGVVNYDYAGVAVPFRQTETLALSAIRLGVDDIPIPAIPRPDLATDTTYTDEDGKTRVNRPYIDRYVSDAEYAFYMSYAKKRSETFSYGINAKVVHKNVGDNSAWGLGFDIGVRWRAWQELVLGANFQDVTTTLLAWDTGRQELIAPTLKLGGAYPFAFNFAKSRLLLAADVDIRFEGRGKDAAQISAGPTSWDFRFGMEYRVYDLVSLRLGRDDLGCRRRHRTPQSRC